VAQCPGRLVHGVEKYASSLLGKDLLLMFLKCDLALHSADMSVMLASVLGCP
jgi:hypothetical protein